jgi:hypothetical protein
VDAFCLCHAEKLEIYEFHRLSKSLLLDSEANLRWIKPVLIEIRVESITFPNTNLDPNQRDQQHAQPKWAHGEVVFLPPLPSTKGF